MHKVLVLFWVYISGVVAYAQFDSIIPLPIVTIEGEEKVTINSTGEQIISSEKIATSPAINVAEAISWAPGIYLQDYGGIGGLKTVSNRGFSGNYTSVFMDGYQIENVQATQVDLSTLDSRMAESVSFTTNRSFNNLTPASAYISPHSLTVNSQLVDSNYTKVGFLTGSFGLISPNVSLNQKLHSNHLVHVTSDLSYANGSYDFNYKNGTENLKGSRNGADVKRLNTFLNYQYTIRDSVSLTAFYKYSKQQQGLPGAVIFYNPTTGQSLENESNQFNVSLKNERNRLRWKSTIGYNTHLTKYEDSTYLNSDGFLKSDYANSSYLLSAVGNYNITKSTKIATAFDIKHTNLEIQDEVFRNALVYYLGIESKYKSVKGSAFTTFQKTQDQLNNEVNFNREDIGGGATLSWFPIPASTLKLYTSFGHYVRYPNFQELYYQRVSGTIIPESLNSFYLGSSYLFTSKNRRINTAISGDFFRNNVKDKIISIPTQNLFVWSTLNLGRVEITGIELNTEVNFKVDSNNHLSTSFSYTYQQALDVTNKNSTVYGHQIAYTPFELFKTLISYSFKKSTFSYSSMYSGFRYALGENKEENLLPAWTTHNLSFAQSFMVKSVSTTLSLKANNISNQNYAVIKNFPMPGRHYYISIQIII